MAEMSDNDFMNSGAPATQPVNEMGDDAFMSMQPTQTQQPPQTGSRQPIQVPYDKNDDAGTAVLKHVLNTAIPYMVDTNPNLSTGQQLVDQAKSLGSGVAQTATAPFAAASAVGNYAGTAAANLLTGRHEQATPSAVDKGFEDLDYQPQTATGERLKLVGGILPGAAGAGLASEGKSNILPPGTNSFAKPNPPTKAQSIIQQALKTENIDPEEIAASLENSQQKNLGLTPLDLLTQEQGGVTTRGKNFVGLTKAAATFPGEASALSGQVAARGANFGDEASSAFDDFLGNTNYYQKAGQLKQQMKDAGPAYQELFSRDSTAPLETQFENHFNNLSQQEQQANKLLQDANNRMTQAQAKLSNAGANVYGVNSGNEAVRAAQSDIDTATQLRDQVAQQKQSALSKLQQAQQDRANGVQGAVWSPKIDQALKQPEIQAGIKQGLQLERLDAFSEDRPFNPTNYALKGDLDDSGDPIVSSVPNMRLLDAGKRGLDRQIEAEEKPTGGYTQLGRSLIMAKNRYLNELDSLEPAYKDVRWNYADPASQAQYLRIGRDFTSMDPEEISEIMQNPNVPDANKASFALGARRNLEDTMNNNSNNSRMINQLWKDKYQTRLQAMAPDAQSFQNLSERMNALQTKARVNQIHSGGSDTMLKNNFGQQIEGSPVLNAVGRVTHAVTSPGTAALREGAGFLDNRIQKSAAGMSNQTAGEIMRYMTQPDPEAWRALKITGQAPTKGAPYKPPVASTIDNSNNPWNGQTRGGTVNMKKGGRVYPKPTSYPALKKVNI